MIPVEAPRVRARVILLAVLVVCAAVFLVARGLAPPPPRADAPAGYRPMEVGAVTPSEGGYQVTLVDARRSTAVLMYVGSSEGLAISLRTEGLRYPRPLSADLLDTLLRELGGELERVQVDALRGGTFYGTIRLRQGARSFDVDARPSDAIALALGRHAPILVADSVLAAAGRPIDR